MEFSRVVLRVDLARLAENFRVLQRRAAGCPLLAVVKADAYGLGVLPVAETLKKAGAAKFAVATLAEAEQIEPLGLPVQILGVLFPEETETAVALNLICPVPDRETAVRLSAVAQRQKRRVRAAVKIDTGMGRLGFLLPEAAEQIRAIRALPGIELYGIYSHLPQAGESGTAFTIQEIAEFRRLVDSLAAEGIVFHDVHIAASGGIANYPESLQKPFTLARAGLVMYGGNDDPELPFVFSLSSKLGSIRVLPAGATVGYNRTYTLKEPLPVGTVAAGYADGVPLALTNCGRVLIHGKSCPVLGRVCMDYTMVSLKDVPEAKPGDEVVLFGAGLAPEEWAEHKKTHLHDILCSIGSRVKREYLP